MTWKRGLWLCMGTFHFGPQRYRLCTESPAQGLEAAFSECFFSGRIRFEALGTDFGVRLESGSPPWYTEFVQVT